MSRKRMKAKGRNVFNPRRLNETQEFFLITGVVFPALTEGELGFGPSNPRRVSKFTAEDMKKLKQLWDWHKFNLMSRFNKEKIYAWSLFEGEEGLAGAKKTD